MITRSDDDLVSNLNVTDRIISDHLAVHCKIAFKKPSYKRKEISYRNCKSVDKQSFITDIKESFLNNFENISDVTELPALYGNTLSSILEKHAPLRKRTVTMRPGTPEREKGQGVDVVEGHRQNFNYVKIHTLEFRGSVAFFLRQILTEYILSIASAITLDINTSQISSIDSATAGFIITY